jgi:hypothetical protein
MKYTIFVSIYSFFSFLFWRLGVFLLFISAKKNCVQNLFLCFYCFHLKKKGYPSTKEMNSQKTTASSSFCDPQVQR